MSAPFLRVELLQARLGDCIWLEYGHGDDVNRILIDGGPVSTFESIQKRLAKAPAGDRAFELIVLTHVDADHIEGLVRLFAENPLPFTVDQVWFNGWRQMNQAHGLLGPLQGEFLSALLADRAAGAWSASSPPWLVPNQGKLPTYTLDSGMKLTLLSPNPAKLDKMARKWKPAIQKQGFAPGDLSAAWKALAKRKKFLPKKGLLGTTPNLDALLKKQFLSDSAVPNGSSIALLAEYEGKSVLLLADAHPDVVAGSVKRLCLERGTDRLAVDAVKVAHHGSKHNTSEALLKLLHSSRYLVSTNGDQFRHPDKECIARVLRVGKPSHLYFNYETKYTKLWLTQASQKHFQYTAVARRAKDLTLKVEL
jgi:beta-lactamase superfamily II metal-dependent hydrolase